MAEALSFSGVTVECKANVYFDGKVVSHTVQFADNTKKNDRSYLSRYLYIQYRCTRKNGNNCRNVQSEACRRVRMDKLCSRNVFLCSREFFIRY